MQRSDLWYGTSGPPDADIVLVGESWGAEEANVQRPFVGSSGHELDRMLADAGLQRDQILCTNVIAERPYANETWRFFHPRATPSGLQLIGGLDPRDNVRADICRLYQQIMSSHRCLVIAAGNYALWALSRGLCGVAAIRESNGRRVPPELAANGPTGISNWRGSMWYVEPPEGLDLAGLVRGSRARIPLLPILHPAAIMRDWPSRAPTVHDLRARVPMAMSSNWRHSEAPVFLAPPSYGEVRDTLRMWLEKCDLGDDNEPLDLAVDLETARGFITCLGIADSPLFAMSIPFIRRTDLGLKILAFDSWWTPEEEAEIVSLLRRIFRHPRIRISGQNFIYDTQYIQHWLGVTPRLDFDTMLAQNVLFPGTPKDLSYLSSLYCRYHWYWKEDHKEWDGKGTIEDLLTYNAWDCVRTWEIAREQRKVLASEGQLPQMAIKMRTSDLCLRMMNCGVRIDTGRRTTLIIELSEAIHRIQAELETIIPQSWVDLDGWAELERRRAGHGVWRKKDENYVRWHASPKQTKTVLHDILGLPPVQSRKTGSTTSGKEARTELSSKFPEWAPLLARLGMLESLENTASVLHSGLDPDNRMRCSFNPGGTETHRLSSSKNAFGRGTNLQNLTKGDEE